jgi:hypothetical protein
MSVMPKANILVASLQHGTPALSAMMAELPPNGQYNVQHGWTGQTNDTTGQVVSVLGSHAEWSVRRL